MNTHVKKLYGMRLRGFSLGCQPMKGFVRRHDDTSGKYYDIIEYDRMLTAEELIEYSLEEIWFDENAQKFERV